MTNPGERDWLHARVPALAAAEYAAVCRFFGPALTRRRRGGGARPLAAAQMALATGSA